MRYRFRAKPVPRRVWKRTRVRAGSFYTVDDFYTDGAEAAGAVESAPSASDAGSAVGNVRIVRIRVVREGADDHLPTFGSIYAAQLRPLVQNVSLGMMASVQPALDNWRVAHSKMLAGSFEPLVKSVNLGIAGSLQPALDAIAAYAQMARADLLANIAAITQAWPEGIDVGGVAVPKPSLSGVGEVVLPGGTNAWPAIADQLQRIGALPCGHIYAIVFFLVLIALMPKLADEIGDAALFLAVTNAIIRNGQR